MKQFFDKFKDLEKTFEYNKDKYKEIFNNYLPLDEIEDSVCTNNNTLDENFRLAFNLYEKDSHILTMPELIYARTKVNNDHFLNQESYATHTEDHVGLDVDGLFYKKDTPTLVVTHGGGSVTPDRISDTIKNQSIRSKSTEEEFYNLLKGNLKYYDGNTKIYEFEEIKDGIQDLPHRYGVAIPLSVVNEYYQNNNDNEFFRRNGFVNHPLNICRNGGIENLEEFFEKVKSPNDDICVKNIWKSIEPRNYFCYLNILNKNYEDSNLISLKPKNNFLILNKLH